MTQPSLTSLYRQLVRESNKLPYGYLRAFFRFKSRDDGEAALHSYVRGKRSFPSRLKRLNKNAKLLAKANAGDKPCIRRVLDQAYGRTGKLKHELIEPFIQASMQDRGPPIIAGKEKSRPPAYPPYLRALLLTSFSRTTGKPLKAENIRLPPSLPDRIDPDSEAVRLLGRVSKRREVNARWRFFTEEVQKILPPFEVSTSFAPEYVGLSESMNKSCERKRSVEGGFQNVGLLDTLIQMAGAMEGPPQPRRARNVEKDRSSATQGAKSDDTSALKVGPIPSRTLRRLHRELLGKIPVLGLRSKDGMDGSFEVKPPKGAHTAAMRYTAANIPEVDDTNMAWVLEATRRDGLPGRA